MRQAVLVAAVLANASLPSAQSPQAPKTPAGRRFDVVSIKPNRNGGNVVNVQTQPGGRFVMMNAPIARMIRIAYPNVNSQIVGAPSWVDSERYDVDARAGNETTASEMQAMLRALLADRFRLAAHVESREQNVYALRVARGDRRLGPELRPATIDCAEFVERRPASGLNLPPRANGAPPCGLSSDGRKIFSGGLTMAQLIRHVSPFVARTIVDKTGLDGYYEFTLEYSARPDNAVGLPDSADDRPSMFTALREQLGLTLQPQRAAVDVLVIDQIERPAAN